LPPLVVEDVHTTSSKSRRDRQLGQYVRLDVGVSSHQRHDDAMPARYDAIGVGYAAQRRADPRIGARIDAALGDAVSVVNVGAGAGSYEPADRAVVAVEPSPVMAAQRSRHLPPAVLAVAERLPFADKSADAVMAVLTMHHWSDKQAGIREAIRVARRRVVLVTVDPEVEARMWLFQDYVPEVAAADATEFPAIRTLVRWLAPNVLCHAIPVPADCTDGFLLSFWSTPERVLDADARRATSGFARLAPDVEERAVTALAQDLASGAWDEKYGDLRGLTEYDAGLRLVVAEL
jgi:SAM-dependent methyltransferase